MGTIEELAKRAGIPYQEARGTGEDDPYLRAEAAAEGQAWAMMPAGWELREVQQGGPWQAWGARLYWDGVLVHVLRSFANREGMERSAREFAERMGSGHPQTLARWSRCYGSLALGEQVYRSA